MRFTRVLRTLGGITAVLAMAYGQYLIRLNRDDAQATLLFVIAAALAAILLGWERPAEAAPWPPPVRRRRWVRVTAAFGIVVGIAAIVAASSLLSLGWAIWFVRGGALLLSGIVVLSVSLRFFDPPRLREPAWTRTEVIVLALILLTGGFLRFHRYSEFPGPFTAHAIEEPQTGNGGYKILKEGTRPWEFLGDHYLAALGIYLSGDPSMQSVRFPFTVFNLLTIVPLYLVLRQLVRRPAALAATFLYAVLAWNVIYSRCAHNIFLTNIVVVTNLALLLQFARSGRLAYVPWIGLLSGYTLYVYAGYRGTTLITLVFLALLLVRHAWGWRRASAEVGAAAARRVGRDLVAAGLVVFIAAAMLTPIVVITTSNKAQPDYYFEAAKRSLSNRQYYTADSAAFFQQRLQRVHDTARIFMHLGDGGTFNAPSEPMLDPLTAVCFVGGLFVAAWFPFRRFNAFFLFMILFLLAGGAVFVQNLDIRRLQGVTPMVAVFSALFLDTLWAVAQPLPVVLRRILMALLCTTGAAFAFGWSYNVYFHKMAGDPGVRQMLRGHYLILVHYGRTEGSGRQMLLLSYIKSFFQPSDYYWLVDGVIDGRALLDLNEVLPPNRLPEAQRPRSVVIQTPLERQATAELLTSLYPGTRCHDFVEPENIYISLTVCDLPPQPEARPFRSALEARYWIGPAGQSEPVVVRQEPFIGYVTMPRACYFRIPPESPQTCAAEWRGTIELDHDETLGLQTALRGQTTAAVTVDGEPLRPGPLHLAAGLHEIVVRAQWDRSPDSGVQLARRTADGAEVLPFYRMESPVSEPADPLGAQAVPPVGEGATDGERR